MSYLSTLHLAAAGNSTSEGKIVDIKFLTLCVVVRA